jgi:hypothetical protein
MLRKLLEHTPGRQDHRLELLVFSSYLAIETGTETRALYGAVARQGSLCHDLGAALFFRQSRWRRLRAMSEHEIRFVLSDLPETDQSKLEQLSAALADQIIPAIAEAAGVQGAQLAAHALVDLAYIVGLTHRPEDLVALMAAVTDAMRSGISDFDEEASDGEVDPEAELAEMPPHSGILH